MCAAPPVGFLSKKNKNPHLTQSSKGRYLLGAKRIDTVTLFSHFSKVTKILQYFTYYSTVYLSHQSDLSNLSKLSTSLKWVKTFLLDAFFKLHRVPVNSTNITLQENILIQYLWIFNYKGIMWYDVPPSPFGAVSPQH
jgi:hypothetical protein